MVAHLTHFCATCDAGRRRHGDAEGNNLFKSPDTETRGHEDTGKNINKADVRSTSWLLDIHTYAYVL